MDSNNNYSRDIRAAQDDDLIKAVQMLNGAPQWNGMNDLINKIIDATGDRPSLERLLREAGLDDQSVLGMSDALVDLGDFE